MSSPLALLPLALAAGNGAIDSLDTRRLVAAGLTMLQRSAPLVRALHGRRAAILLPPSPHTVTALAASEGRGAVLIDPRASRAEVEYQVHDAAVGAVFTLTRLATLLPDDVPRVLLDELPNRALWTAAGASRPIDLGSHVPLHVEGETDVDGSLDEAILVYPREAGEFAPPAVATHRDVLANARAMIEGGAITRADHALALLSFADGFGLVGGGLAPLLAGARVTCLPHFDALEAIDRLERDAITLVAAVPAIYAAVADALERRGAGLAAPALRLCICGGDPPTPGLQARWRALTHTTLWRGDWPDA